MKKKKSKYTPTSEEKEIYQRESNLRCDAMNIPKHAQPKPKYNQGSQANFWEDLIMLWAKNRGFAPSKVDVRGTWRADLNRYTKSSTTNGFPDIALCVSGMFLAVEVKGKGDRQSEDQKAWQDRHERAGGHYLIFDSIECLEKLSDLTTFIQVAHEQSTH